MEQRLLLIIPLDKPYRIQLQCSSPSAVSEKFKSLPFPGVPLASNVSSYAININLALNLASPSPRF